ncbi:ArsR family transcriptional regulator [Salinirubrum litoreum]|uniref:ArsR family transcriptional regulator n=1 Tax=Salinirubrum litoreum TaxID=1126234 RepID=A0ABD5RAI5_9EURY|nr:ArsR family transcriptional regulator [Salinirubrum litoreum]
MSDGGERTRNDRGQYADRIPPEAVLEVFEARDDWGRPLTASDVLEELDCSRRTAHNKLNELVDRGDLRTRKVGARSRVWWRQIDPADVRTEAATDEEERPPEVAAAIGEADLPGSGPRLDARREALSAAYEYLTDHPEAKKADFLRDVYAEHPAGYESAEAWWNAIQPALKELPGVDPPDERGHLWHFLGG